MKSKKLSIIYIEKIHSTQKYLIEKIKNNEITDPVCVWTDLQTDGIGSRNNRWLGKKGNLFFSFAYDISFFYDVPLQSLSVYFGWLFKKTLNELGSKAVMKWPNDIYLNEKKLLKIGGVLSSVTKNKIICGIGLNTKFAPSDEFGCLDIDIKNDKILKAFFNKIEKNILWKEVLEEFKTEFNKTKKLFQISGELEEDGSLKINEKRMYSKR
jgi:BirA family biotin operon repressor/biotin-[acetyl-CoA-carboxylase] ligase